MPWYITVYDAAGQRTFDLTAKNGVVGGYGGYLFARSERHARALAKRRGLGEQIIAPSGRRQPYRAPSQWLTGRTVKDKDAFHALCWFGHLAIMSGAATVAEILGDTGLLHEWAHMRNFGGRASVTRRQLVAMAKRIEARIPGFLPTGDSARATAAAPGRRAKAPGRARRERTPRG